MIFSAFAMRRDATFYIAAFTYGCCCCFVFLDFFFLYFVFLNIICAGFPTMLPQTAKPAQQLIANEMLKAKLHTHAIHRCRQCTHTHTQLQWSLAFVLLIWINLQLLQRLKCERRQQAGGRGSCCLVCWTFVVALHLPQDLAATEIWQRLLGSSIQAFHFNWLCVQCLDMDTDRSCRLVDKEIERYIDIYMYTYIYLLDILL